MSTSASAPGPVRFLLVVSLAVGLVAGALPLAAWLWLEGLLSATELAGRLLGSTGGLERSTFGTGLTVAAVVMIAVAGFTLVRGRARDEEDGRRRWWRRPTLAALVVFGVAALVLVPLDKGVFDVPDVLTTVPLLGVLLTLLVLGPFALLSVGVDLVRWLWRWGSASTGRAVVAIAVLGLAVAWSASRFGAGTGVVPQPDDAEEQALIDAVEEVDLRQDWADQGHKIMMVVAEDDDDDDEPRVEDRGGSLSPEEQARFEECVESLVPDAPREIRVLVGRGHD